MDVDQIVLALKKGETVVCPTDTVYGIIADAGNKEAVENIFRIKKRSKEKILPVFVKDIETAKALAEIGQEKVLKKHWPGKYTFILNLKNKSQKFSKLIIGKNNTIGIRIPKYKLLNEILEKIDRPLAQTSANISGEPATTKISEVIKYFENEKFRPDLIIDAGDLPKSKPSRIIDLTSKYSTRLR